MQTTELRQDSLLSLATILPPAFAGFFVAFGCWTLFAVIGVHVRTQLGLTDIQFGLLLALPILSGGVIAVPAGILAQRFGARSVMLGCLAGLIPIMALLSWVESLWSYFLVACGLGLAGGTFSSGLQFLSNRAPPRHRGLALSLFTVGMLGAGFNYYLVSVVHEAYSWRAAPMAYLVLLVVVTALYALLTEPDTRPTNYHGPNRKPGNIGLLYNADVLLLCLLFAVTGGGILALALWLPDFISASFDLPLNHGARLATGFIAPAALCQVLGGWLADRCGAVPVLRRALMASLIPGLLLSYPTMSLAVEGSRGLIHLQIALPLAVEIGLIGLLGVTLGIALGSLLRLLVELQPERTAFCAGLMLLSGCLAGFLLPLLFAMANHWIGIRSAAFMLLFGFSAVSLWALTLHSRRYIRRRLLKGEKPLSPWG
ncbi:nitrate/nitrite transporter [Marinobacter nanhaiticus D15-8W]|uniref:MFS transporter n=1 Tax=Marinobacter nanhaiticus D15-8W TaxID=626887 RepID=N6W7Y5_9GAMM|nr:MFS transporter [Marinobacter nanhaiticus]ENO16374.1 MFS transporter [Marinobacter nanhaiticus D15-8W]BES72765.1 nitrate/nitrite transporter [Marinobacter nanhaiticus D15-8W]